MRRGLWLHAALVVAGLAALLWALTAGASPVITCRGAVMVPGDTCANADGDAVQTYEQRWAAAQQARPVVAGVGVVVAAFGAALAVGARREASDSREEAHPR